MQFIQRRITISLSSCGAVVKCRSLWTRRTDLPHARAIEVVALLASWHPAGELRPRLLRLTRSAPLAAEQVLHSCLALLASLSAGSYRYTWRADT